VGRFRNPPGATRAAAVAAAVAVVAFRREIPTAASQTIIVRIGASRPRVVVAGVGSNGCVTSSPIPSDPIQSNRYFRFVSVLKPM